MTNLPVSDPLSPCDSFARRHLGSTDAEIAQMLATLGEPSLDALIAKTVPSGIRLAGPMNLPAAAGENAALAELRALAAKNRIFRSFIGEGYYDCFTPGVIQRNILESPAWYTASDSGRVKFNSIARRWATSATRSL